MKSHSRQSLIYKISREDIEWDSWLIATMHVKDSKAFVHVPFVLELIKKVELFCSEVDQNDMQANFSPAMFLMADDISLSDLWTPRYFQKAQKIIMKSFGIDLIKYNRFQPMIIVNELSLAVLKSQEPLPLDMALWMKAGEAGLELSGLEDVKDQVDTLAGLDIDVQLKMLRDVIRNTPRFRQHTLKLLDHFHHGHVHRLYMLSKKSLGTMKTQMIRTRNEKMTARFVDCAQQKPLAAAIGAGHFSGPFGLIRLLRKDGFSVTPQPFR